jgi:predicted metalloprotease with PDZ domain
MRALAAALLLVSATASAQTAQTIRLDVDARDVPRRIVHAKLTIPARPGSMTLLYPKWLPGEHGPTGPIVNLAGPRLTAAGKPLVWRRDGVDMYAFHVEVPPGATSVTAELDFLLPGGAEGFTASASSTRALSVLSWNQVLLYPQGARGDEQQVAASLRLPPGWKAGTSLRTRNESGNPIVYQPVSMTELVDAPVLMGAYTRVTQLLANPPVRLFVAADSEAALEAPPAFAAALARLPAEANALFGSHHYRTYTFLLTLSDQVGSFGLEHHESSDNRLGERLFLDKEPRLSGGGLLPHEMVHSWNGKYRRPADLAPGTFEAPMKGELLWVYEGLTEYLGAILTARSGILSPEEYREALALTAGGMELSKGRSWRALVDTTDAAQVLYNATEDHAAWRRSVDFYDEGELLWLEVDAIIREKSGGRASIDDFCRRFHGGESGPPRVVTYTLADVIAALEQTAPYDWKRFFQERVYAPRPQVPVAGIEAAGWKLVYSDKLPSVQDANELETETIDVRHAIGILVKKDGTIPDVIPGSPAAVAGIPPGAKLVAVNGRKWSVDRLREAVRESKARKSIELIVDSGEFVTVHKLAYSGGERYPHLERIAGKADLLTRIITPLTASR